MTNCCGIESGPMNFTLIANNYCLIEMTAIKLSDDLPQDLTGYEIKWQAFDSDGNSVITKQTGSGISILDQETSLGKFTITINEDDTKDLPYSVIYIHEPVLTIGSDSFTGSNGGPELRAGQFFLRKQNTVQS